MLSMMWYSDDDAMAMIAGMAYRAKSLPSESVPSETVLFCTDDDIYSLFIRGGSYDHAIFYYLSLNDYALGVAHLGNEEH